MIRRGGLVWKMVAVLALIPLGPAAVHAASTVTVSTCDESHLRSAMGSAGAGGTVTFSCSGTITVASTLTISQSLTLDGSGQAVTISGGHSVVVLSVNTGVSVTLNHLTIANGGNSSSNTDGGGIYNVGGTVNVTNSTLSSNSSSPNRLGGGIYNGSSGTLHVTNSILSGNSAPNGYGGGIYNGGTLTMMNSTLSGNSAFNGGGIFNSGTLSVANSTLGGNSAPSNGSVNGCGGGIFNGYGGALSIINSTLNRNSAPSGSGGGLCNIFNGSSGTVNVANSTLSDNSSSNGSGGGIFNGYGGPLNVTNSTFSGNSTFDGGSIFNSGTTRLANTIVANSLPGGACANHAGSVLTDAGGNVEDGTTCGFSTANQSLSNTNPQLLPLLDNGGPTQTMALASTSPAIGAGLAATCLSTAPTSPVNNLDQRGMPRHAVLRGTCDSGAYDTGGSAPGAPLFATSFEPGQPQPSWTNTVDTGGYPAGGINNVAGICCGLPGPEAGVRHEVTHTGRVALMYSGQDMNADSSYAYLKVFDLSAQPLKVGSGTVLSYWIYPQSSHTSPVSVSGNNSTCVAIDLIFGDGKALRDTAAIDQNGHRMHPAWQCGNLTLDAWNHVTSTIGAAVAGKSIIRLDVGYDQPGNTGGYRGYIDDITIQ